jgi:acetylornithine deacetylase
MTHEDAIALLQRLIATPSLSREEGATAEIIADFLSSMGVEPRRLGNNVWAVADTFNPERPTLLLNSHHDTVKPSPAYTRPPFTPCIEGNRLYGLGSNDAGASVVSLITAFSNLRSESLPVNLVLAISAEEEVTGEGGLRALIAHWQEIGLKIDMALVGEPTQMNAAVGERGLVVLDGVSTGRGGHAARTEGDNALYHAIDDINRLREFQFPKTSALLGPIKVTVTQIEAGRQHNVIPEACRFVADVRTTDAYTNEQTVELLSAALSSHSQITPRSTRIRASAIGSDHPLVKTAVALGRTCFVSPTTSDMAAMPLIPSLKMGPGDSARSHTADEYVGIDEIRQAINIYTDFIKTLQL